MKKMIQMFFCAVVVVVLSGCGYNSIQRNDEAVNSTHAQMLSVYKKRADLVPNLVEVVKGYAAHESELFTEVTKARARVSQVNFPTSATEEQMKLFLASQRELTTSLSRLIAVAENYPQLKADQGFRQLQGQLEVVESQATAARNRYIRSIEYYNRTVRQFPTNLTAAVFGYHPKPQMQFEDENEIKISPRVTFGNK